MTRESHQNYLWIYHSCWYRKNKRMTNTTTVCSTTCNFNSSDVLSPTTKSTDISQPGEPTDATRTKGNAQNGLWHCIKCTLTVRVRTVVETIQQIVCVCATEFKKNILFRAITLQKGTVSLCFSESVHSRYRCNV